ncbi:hypothetical protein HK102_008064 [Quaeritorhiza haematococci]|nr:hypothetical protein HK102_008064 [Quaeritorhiza haematococci]
MATTATSSPTFIGIGFGSSFSTISIIGKEGKIETIADENGDRNIASYLAFTSHDELVGSQAKHQAIRNASNTITMFRDLLGKSYDDEAVQEHTRKLRLNIEPSPKDESVPTYAVDVYPNPDADPVVTNFTPIEITAKFLSKLKQTAEAYLGESVQGCVISRPSIFGQSQVDALIEAGKGAGFTHVFAVSEPIAAALAFENLAVKSDAQKNAAAKVDRTIAVLDLGGHEFNATVLSVNNGLYTIMASLDDFNLGGVHFDEVLGGIVAEEFRRKTRMDVRDNRRAMTKLRVACEQTKRILSQKDQAPCSVESLYDGMDYHGSINRSRFEMAAESLFKRCAQLIHETLKKANVTAEDIDEVLLVGGSSRIPRFQSVVRSIFSTNVDTRIRSDIEPDEAVSCGCAVQANVILTQGIDNYSKALADPSITTSVPHLSSSIGIADAEGAFRVLLPRGAPLPCRRTLKFSNAEDEQQHIFMALYEGESKVAAENEVLAHVVLSDLPKGLKRGQANIEVTMTIESDMNLMVTARERTMGKRVQVKMTEVDS